MLTHKQSVDKAIRRQQSVDKLMNSQPSFKTRLAFLNRMQGEGRVMQEAKPLVYQWMDNSYTR